MRFLTSISFPNISEDLTGTIALIDRGVCSFTTKIRNAQNAGAIGVLVANNVAGDPVAMAHDGTDPFPTIPAAMVSKDNGAAMKPSGTVTVDGTAVQEFFTDNEDIIAGFSSRGPTPFNYLIKPDVTAPGVNVVSSVFEGEFAFFQGTSMATPHLAGGAALLLDLNPDWSPADVKSAMVNTAKRPVWDHVNGTNPVGVLARG
ncbi:MAG TPA: S8 family serine peptidase, partial [Anaerolineales bacterium]